MGSVSAVTLRWALSIDSDVSADLSFAMKFRDKHPVFSVLFFFLIILMAVLFVIMASILIYEHFIRRHDTQEEERKVMQQFNRKIQEMS